MHKTIAEAEAFVDAFLPQQRTQLLPPIFVRVYSEYVGERHNGGDHTVLVHEDLGYLRFKTEQLECRPHSLAD